MEVSSVKDGSLKIKSKDLVISIDPTEVTEGRVVLYMSTLDQDSKPFTVDPLVIQGPGEYEIHGVSVTGRYVKGETAYSISDGTTTMLLLSSSSISGLKEEDEYSAIILKVNEEVTDTIFSTFASSVLLFFGDLGKINISSDNRKEMNKVNLKKREELTGSAILLK